MAEPLTSEEVGARMVAVLRSWAAMGPHAEYGAWISISEDQVNGLLATVATLEAQLAAVTAERDSERRGLDNSGDIIADLDRALTGAEAQSDRLAAALREAVSGYLGPDESGFCGSCHQWTDEEPHLDRCLFVKYHTILTETATPQREP